jgi:hypothetical protein
MPGIGSAAGAVDAAATLCTAQQLRDSRLGAVVSHHREDFDIDERSLLIGASVLLRLAEGLAPAAALAAAPATAPATAPWVAPAQPEQAMPSVRVSRHGSVSIAR